MAAKLYGEQTRDRVVSIMDVQPADLIAFPRYTSVTTRTILYWHFAIVEEIDAINDTLTVIHFQAGYEGAADLGAKSQASIARQDVRFAAEEVHVVRVDPALCLQPQEVLVKARSKIGEQGYNLVFNNCEHFGIWCKTGYKYSSQVLSTTKAVIGIATQLLKK